MFFNDLIMLRINGYMARPAALLMVIVCLFSCGTQGGKFSQTTIEYHDGVPDRPALAIRFAPWLYLHPDEPFGIVDIIPVFHPTKPIVAYHIFFEDEILFLGRGKEIDHEILWVEYDPITLKAADVMTLWHRTVLRTDTCLMNARASQQRPSVCIQWGQHGILPLGWEKLTTARPRLDLLTHYNIVKDFSRLPWIQNTDSLIVYRGSREEYRQFTREVDSAGFLKNQSIIVAEHSEEELKLQVKQSFAEKKEWPFWSPR